MVVDRIPEDEREKSGSIFPLSVAVSGLYYSVRRDVEQDIKPPVVYLATGEGSLVDWSVYGGHPQTSRLRLGEAEGVGESWGGKLARGRQSIRREGPASLRAEDSGFSVLPASPSGVCRCMNSPCSSFRLLFPFDTSNANKYHFCTSTRATCAFTECREDA